MERVSRGGTGSSWKKRTKGKNFEEFVKEEEGEEMEEKMEKG